MSRNEHKRVKHRQEPGDVPKQVKIAMREKRTPIQLFPWQVISDEAAKTFRNVVKEKGRTVQRRRDKAAIEAELEDRGTKEV